ncbi:leucine-rich repeat-containing protein 14-like [Gigantopelta aegis]|uniref:leucine-rich repeat-containing protein 14-like n=1 Tax=Gigantopelta aegis TaxID=1735272 RepID=UPI001B888C79|nr:leucine-rich repeat-containing protein 14-like [Gigantopelta aegis]
MDSTKNLLWYDHYKGAVYPLDLSVHPDSVRIQKLGQASCIGSTSKNIPSLVHICSNFIVRDSTLTKKAISIVPTTLLLPLIQEALLSNKDRALNVLISHWSAETLSLKNLVPSIFSSILPLYDSEYLSNIVRRGVMCTTNLAHGVIHMLQQKTSTSKLKYLDLTGYPTAEVMLEYITSSCMLAHSEQALVERINKVMEYSARSSQSYDFHNISYVLPQDSCLLIKLDAFVTSWSCYSALCKALKVSTFENRNLRLCIQRLGVTCLGQSAIGLLLKQLDSEHLLGLQVKYNSLNRDEFVKLAPVLKTLTNLTALDLSCNCIYFWDSEITCLAAADVFGSLRNLIRLDLSNSRIKTKLRRILADIHQPLQYLRLAGCTLTVSDITYLSLSHHTAGLRELILSENNLGPAARNLCHLLTSCASNLNILELQECGLSDSHLRQLQDCFSQLEALLYLNYADNIVSLEDGKNLTHTLARLHEMQVLRFSFPVELYGVEEGDSERWKTTFSKMLAEIVCEECDKVGKSKPLRLVLSELEPAIQPMEVN